MLKIYNTLTKKKETFKPRKGKKVNMFVCGPTVYELSHIGHARCYSAFDIIAKYLHYKGYDVFYLQNITDVDDKIIKEARARGEEPLKFSDYYTQEYYTDMKSIRVDSVTKYAKASDHIPDILRQVKKLIETGHAYELDDGIYFDVTTFKDYGKLSGRKILEAEDAVSKVDDSVGKRNKADFCMWKFPKAGEPSWKTDMGEGRPGWHVEDTAITEHYFGPQYDLHGAGRDLIFPHHEAEITIMESYSGKSPMVKYWLHNGFINVEGRKMSKSLGNFITIRDVLKKWDVDVLRLMFASTHYRSPIDYSEASMAQAKANLETIRTAIGEAKKKAEYKKWLAEFEKLMDDDFNTPKVVALLLEIAHHMNKTGENLSAAVYKIGDVLGIDFEPQKQKALPKELAELIKKRDAARQKKDWKLADKIRSELKKKGILLDDTKKGTEWKWI